MTVIVDTQAAAKQDIHTQSETTLDPNIKASQEAGDLKVSVITRMQHAWAAVGKAEDSMGKTLLADAVQSIIPVLGLPEKNRPKYAKISELILAAMGREVYATRQFRLADGSIDSRTPQDLKKNAYRQYATPYVTMARWEAGLFNKAEKQHAERNPGRAVRITYQGEQYTSPVAALKGGVPPITTFRLFKNVIAPMFVDLKDLHGTKSENAALARVEKLSIPLRETTNGVQTRGKAKIAGNQSLTVGTIVGLLAKSPKLSQSSHDKISAALSQHAPETK